LRTNANIAFQCAYHVVWCPKYRWPVIGGLDRASRGWRGLTMTPTGTRLLQDLRRSLLHPPRKLRPPSTTTAAAAAKADPVSATA
jgi:hypothetical protein